MKLTVKTLKGSHFEIRVQPTDTIMAVKKNIEDVQGKDNYPCGQQLLIHNGKVLKDESTLAENKVSEDGFLVVMLSKSKTLGSSGTSSTQPGSTTQPISNPTSTPEAPVQAPAPEITSSGSNVATANAPSDTYGQAASILVAGSNLEQTIQQIMDIGGGNWDKEIVTRALRAAYNNPERAVDYLYSGIPEAAEVAVPVAHLPVNQATSEGAETRAAAAAPISGAPNSSPFDSLSLLSSIPESKLKLNVNGSRRLADGGGFGGIFRDETGSWVCGCYGKMDSGTSLETELWALYKGLTVILQEGMHGVVIETDAQQVVQLMEVDVADKFPFKRVAGRCQDHLQGL
ncbi:unnamed protein product [Camellia sinensis]